VKYNLKRFPDVHQWFYRKQVDEWKKGFEAELREIKNNPEEWCNYYPQSCDAESLIQDLIKEILGDK